MTDETPLTANIPLSKNEPPKKKRAPVKRRTPTNTKKPASAEKSVSRSEVDQTLTSLYANNSSDNDVRTIKIKKSSFLGRLFSRLLIAVIIIGLIMWVGTKLNYNNKITSKESSLKVEIQGPSEVVLGAENTFTVFFTNNDSVPLTNITLNIKYPGGFVLISSSLPATNDKQNEWSLGTLAPHAASSLTLIGAEFAPLGQNESWRTFIKFHPSNFNSELQTTATLPLAVKSSPLSVTITGPDTASVGKDVAYTFTVKNDSKTPFLNLSLAPEWGGNFSITSSTPPLVKNRWMTSAVPKVGIFKLLGKFTDAANATSSISARLSLTPEGAAMPLTVGDATLLTTINKNNIDLNMAINGIIGNFSAAPGDILNTTVRLKNNSDHDLKNGIISLAFDAPANDKKQSLLDWNELIEPYNANVFGKQLEGGLRRGTISWDSKKIPGLAKIKPGDEITIDVRLPIKSGKNFDLSALTQNTILASGSFTYNGTTGAEESLLTNSPAITLNSDLDLSVQNKVGTNSDGQKQFSEQWLLTNSFHQLKNITLSADVFGDVLFSYASSSVGAGTVNYDTPNKKLTWHIPDMPVSVDTLAFPFSIIINKNNPTQNTLIAKVHVSAEDTVTGQTIDFFGDEISLPTN
ncbi:MAG: hypothetical protein EXS55_00805 [Candidatus Magasanikbacteria bacterium]|nr:hypothetical protein [Candidatus Magasanikbacteria bacterium]